MNNIATANHVRHIQNSVETKTKNIYHRCLLDTHVP